MCDSENAYCCVFWLYTGKTEQSTSKHGKTYDPVMDIMKDYFRKGHILYIDNYYTSPQLLMDLHKKRTGATGTARNRKGFPAPVRDAKLARKGDKFANLISKLNFYKLIPYPMDNSLSGRRRPARQTSKKDVLCFHRPGRSSTVHLPDGVSYFLPDVIASFSLSKPIRPLVN